MMERLQTLSKIFQTPKQLHDFYMNRGRDAHVLVTKTKTKTKTKTGTGT